MHGASTSEVMAAVLGVREEARRAFGPLLERQATADRIRLVLGVMRRYEAIVRLPARVREHAERGDYEQVRGRVCVLCVWWGGREAEGFVLGGAVARHGDPSPPGTNPPANPPPRSTVSGGV